jgi:selenocysteine lyase/cysteine desulfurase
MTKYLQERSTGKLETFWDDLPMVGELRQFIQRMINAESADRIALSCNTTDSINIVAAGMPWKTGDGILLNNIEFPANVWPYINLKRLGVELDIIQTTDGRITPEQVSKHLGPRTRLLALSAVQYLSGHRADLATIGTLCRERGAVFVVDAIQAVGAVRLDVQAMKIDALAAGGQKWQMSPHGTGFLYLTEELQAHLQQATLGWLAVQDPWNFTDFTQPLASSARRYEGGSLVMPSLLGMHAALSTILETGLDAIEGQILAITRKLIQGFQCVEGANVVTPDADNERAGIVTISLPSGVDEKAVFKSLLLRNIHAAVREHMLRFSPHYYMTEEEMAIVTEGLRESIKHKA